jgi:hypothetical protein
VVLYVDGVRAASVDASDPIDAPDAALVACAEAADGGAPEDGEPTEAEGAPAGECS